ncbi:MAG: DMT family transporter [Ignavibacteriales bacterium]|nr:DMT family transporter [Ignavibacteriales bacterium]
MPLLGELSALLTALLWSGSSIVFASAIRRVGSVHVNVARLIIAAILLVVTIVALGLNTQLSWSQIGNLTASGLIGLVFGDTFLFQSYVYNGARISMIIMSVAPAISAFLAYVLLGEVLSFWGVLGILVTIGGIAVVASDRREDGKHSLTRIGLLYGFFGALGQGAGLIFARLAFDEGEIHGLVATFVRIIPAIIFLYPVAVITKRLKKPIRTFLEDKRAFALTSLGAILGPYFGITFSLIAVAHTKVGIAATLMATSPIMMLPMVKAFEKEILTWKATLGAFVAVAGVAILFLR